MLGFSAQVASRIPSTPLFRHGHNGGANSGMYSSSIPNLSSSTAPDRVEFPPEYPQDAKMPRYIFPPHKSEGDDEPHRPEESKRPGPISHVKSLFSIRSARVRKQDEKVAGKMVGRIRRFAPVLDDGADRCVCEYETSFSSFVSSPSVSLSVCTPSPSASSIASGISGGSTRSDREDPAFSSEYPSPLDARPCHHVFANCLTTDSYIAGCIILQNLKNCQVIDGDLSSMMPTPTLQPFLSRETDGVEWGEDYEILSRGSSISSVTITGTVLELDDVFGLEPSGLSRVPKSSEPHDQNVHSPSAHSNPQGVSDKDISTGQNHEAASHLLDACRGLDVAIADLWKHKGDWEESHHASRASKMMDRGEGSVESSTRRRQLSWDLGEIDEAIREGMSSSMFSNVIWASSQIRTSVVYWAMTDRATGTFNDDAIFEMIDELEELMLDMLFIWKVR
ncbi:hypothetical protein DSL72_004558 [Monilinia vaccinii-corymbosi]|uniref:Uncharacterized protein n=1 Tax=Monilinia vaccinii-corymbosi TaxID=61207 RepID=A0A8A3P0T8_9HELO|nr:hypothetical protein DSL72_004558 [Monilinia vaccinii-corymbosi]